MEEEFRDIDSRNAWNSVYQEIRNESNKFNYTFKEARKNENKILNRYRDVNPFDHSRVCLKRGEKDYINASLVKVPSANRSYILTQGPLPFTSGHFWLMIWEQESKAIVMLNRVIEKNAVKCHQYWPLGSENGGDDEMVLSEVGLMVTFLGSTEAPNYVVRELMLTDFQTGQSRSIMQFHYTTWPDFGVPESPAAFLSFLMEVRNSGALSDMAPAVVHCSAGIGRSGTFCLVDSSLVLIEKKGDVNAIKIRELLLEMRHYRMGLIQTSDQLRFSYLAIIEGSKTILKNKLYNNQVPSAEVPTNNNNESNEEVESHSSSDEGVATTGACNSSSPPPPLPPRPARIQDASPTSCNSVTESLSSGRGSLEGLVCNSVSSHSLSDEGDNELDTLGGNEHPINASGDSNQNTASTSPVSDTVKVTENALDVRKRKRKEREEKTAELVQKIKKKQKETEVWQERKSIIKRISIGLLALLGTVLIYRYYSKG